MYDFLEIIRLPCIPEANYRNFTCPKCPPPINCSKVIGDKLLFRLNHKIRKNDMERKTENGMEEKTVENSNFSLSSIKLSTPANVSKTSSPIETSHPTISTASLTPSKRPSSEIETCESNILVFYKFMQ